MWHPPAASVNSAPKPLRQALTKGEGSCYQDSPHGTWQSHSQMSQRRNQRAQLEFLVTQAEILMHPRLRKSPRCTWVLQDEEHLPVMSRSLISIRPRRQIPARAGPERVTGCPAALQPPCSGRGEKRDQGRASIPPASSPRRQGPPLG